MATVAMVVVARTLLVAPGITSSSKKLLETKGIATSSKDAAGVQQNVLVSHKKEPGALTATPQGEYQ